MVNQSSERLDHVFQALTDPTRRHMLRNLAVRERTISELAEPFSMSLAAASKHVKTLERAGLVRRTVQGRTHFCRLDPKPLAAPPNGCVSMSASGTSGSTRSNSCCDIPTRDNPRLATSQTSRRER